MVGTDFIRRKNRFAVVLHGESAEPVIPGAVDEFYASNPDKRGRKRGGGGPDVSACGEHSRDPIAQPCLCGPIQCCVDCVTISADVLFLKSVTVTGLQTPHLEK